MGASVRTPSRDPTPDSRRDASRPVVADTRDGLAEQSPTRPTRPLQRPWVCCARTSETSTAYGSALARNAELAPVLRVPRQDRLARLARDQDVRMVEGWSRSKGMRRPPVPPSVGRPPGSAIDAGKERANGPTGSISTATGGAGRQDPRIRPAVSRSAPAPRPGPRCRRAGAPPQSASRPAAQAPSRVPRPSRTPAGRRAHAGPAARRPCRC